jgi:hypothetical protein
MIISFILWYLIGCASFVYWWTRDNDFQVINIILMIMAGFTGPLAYFVGYGIHHQLDERVVNFVILKKRK